MGSTRAKKKMRIYRQEATKLIKKASSCGTIYGYSFFYPNARLQDRFYLAGPSTNKVYVRSLRASNNKSYRR